MPHDIPWSTFVKNHPGSTRREVQDEPDWTAGHEHRIGFKNTQERRPGLTHDGDEIHSHSLPDLTTSSSEHSDEELFDEEAQDEIFNLQKQVKEGKLVNFRDLIKHQKNLSLRYPENRPVGWRYVLNASEDWVKNEQNWPINIKRRNEEQKRTADQKKDQRESPNNAHRNEQQPVQSNSNEEHDWKRQTGQDDKHHEARSAGDDASSANHETSSKPESEYEKLLERYSPQEIALLRALQHEKQYRSSLQHNDGKRRSPQTHNRTTISIDEQDQFSPDNWLPRSAHLIRLTGKHPMNAESDLTTLFDAGLITPNELHYVRNHGAVPRLMWEFHTLDVENGKLILSMNDLKHKFESINIPVSLACDGNRRKELNLIRKSKGFNWGAGATGCVYWKGPLLRDVLLAAGVESDNSKGEATQRWVNFEGADEPSEGKYQTCIPLDYAMDPTNDVILPYEMNDLPLPPDHGYPVRLIIPGYVGGRCVKWLSRIWVTDHENDSHYHIWDNRVLPSFITEKDGSFARTMFAHPSTACNEQNLNSTICKPAQGERISLVNARRGNTYRIEGYAYDGGGHEVQRVEITLDGGVSWLYCIRKFPDYPIRHGKKFWTWLHWHIDVSITHLLQAKAISVRAWNVFKNTQPENPNWNTMGMMNNCWYTIKSEIAQTKDDAIPHMLFRHPVEPGTGDGGWMKPSAETQIMEAKNSGSTPQKEFTREEIEKHETEGDCWLVIDAKVYDVTSVLAWHPGGKAAILGHAGKVHQETSDEFASIHDDFAYKKLNECILGAVTEKSANFIKASADAAAKEKANSASKDQDLVLQKHRWTPVTLKDREDLSADSRKYTFALPDGRRDLGLGTCQHVQVGFHLKDKMLIRSYTPTKPLLPDPGQARGPNRQSLKRSEEEIRTLQDGRGTFELVVKTYFPSEEQPGGAMSNLLDCMPIGGQVEIRGPTGEIVYNGNGCFEIGNEKRTFKKISLVLGGSGTTPGYALIARALLGVDESVQVRVVDANKTEKDILLRDELDHFEKESHGRIQITHVLSHPSRDWKGIKGHVDADIIRKSLFPPQPDSACFLCGPPAMIQKAALPALKDWGYIEDKNVFGF